MLCQLRSTLLSLASLATRVIRPLLTLKRQLAFNTYTDHHPNLDYFSGSVRLVAGCTGYVLKPYVLRYARLFYVPHFKLSTNVRLGRYHLAPRISFYF